MKPEKIIEEEAIEVTNKDMLRFIWCYVGDKKWSVFACVSLGLLASSIAALSPVYSGKMVDAMAVGGESALADVWHALWMIILIMLSQQLLKVLSRVASHKYLIGGMKRLVVEISDKIQHFGSEWHENSYSGATLRKVTRGQWAFFDVLDAVCTNLLPLFFLVVSLVVMMSINLPLVGGVMGVMTIIFIVVSVYTSTKIVAPKFRKSVKKDNKISAAIGDVITANQVVKSFGAERIENKNINSKAEVWFDYTMYVWRFANYFSFMRATIASLLVGLVLGTVIWLWQNGEASIGDIALAISSTFILTAYMGTVGSTIVNLQKSLNYLEDVVAIWMREDDVCDAEDALPLVLRDDHKRNKIAFEDVGFIYPRSDIGLFKKLAVKIPDGEHVALVGTSGSGKSTFIKLLQRMYNINEGQIRIDGQDISKVTLESLRQSVSLVPQDPILFHRSLKENISYGKPNASMEEIVEASKKAYIHDFISTLPEGYDTEVGERGIKLSGGERQRVAIARAILANQPILVLDEATSSLDSVSEQYIKQAMEKLVEGKTTITVAHRLSTVRNSDRILVFSKGKIIEQGKHDELMKDKNSQYKTLYDTQSLGIVIRDGE